MTLRERCCMPPASASAFTTTESMATGAKPWKYLLIPHDLVTEDKRLVDYLSFQELTL